MNYKKYNDYELIYMVRENDEDSRNLLSQKYYPIIQNIANTFYQKYKNYGYDYDDFFQEANYAFQKALLSYNENRDSLFYTFAVLCIRRGLISFCRKITHNYKSILGESFWEMKEENVIDVKSDMNIIFDDIEFQDIFRKVLLKLPFEESSILELKKNGFTYREISTLLDIPTSSVEFKSRRGRKLLRDAYLHYYGK